MAITYARKKRRQNNALITVITVILICAVFLTMVASLYFDAEKEAYETLHVQTKQIKDDLTLQLNSDMENLATMANFAAKLNAEGEDYSLMFEAFKPIGLFSRIGILTPDCDFITKESVVPLSDRMSFEEQVSLGEHVTGRAFSYSVPDQEVVRCSVPIVVNGENVGIMYGIIKIQDINNKYRTMAKELNAQLFVYDRETGKFVIDTIDENPGELSQFKNREYRDGYSYEELVNTDKGFTSFKSIFTGEDLYIHYSTIEDFGWGIMLGRYENQVFAATHNVATTLLLTFAMIILVIVVYLQMVLKREQRRTKLNAESAEIRKLLLETNNKYTNVVAALKKIEEFSRARSAFYADTDGEDYNFANPSFESVILFGEDRKYFVGELFKYAANAGNAGASTFGFMQIIPNSHLENTNSQFYEFMVKHGIADVSFAIIADESNRVGLLGTVNPKKSSVARDIIEDVAVCFSIAMHNKKHLSRTELAATTDSLTGVLNRVAYKNDIAVFDEECPEDFSCLYIDVNELHFINNKFGHAAGDEMLIFIANTLKEVFFGHRVYRMGGDEFLVFTKNEDPSKIKENIDIFTAKLDTRGYHVAIGMSYRSSSTNCEEMVREAEVRMYEAKARYYQDKGQVSVSEETDKNYIQVKTGIREIDTMISILKEHYNGIYRVSLENDSAHRILMPSYLGYNEEEKDFSKLLGKYFDDSVHPDFRRAVMNFVNYDAIKMQLAEGKVPSITYKKANGETVILSVHKLADSENNVEDTLWVFAKD